MLEGMDLSGLLLMMLGVVILLCMRGDASVKREIEPKLFRRNFPGLAARFPWLPDQYGEAAGKASVAIGTVVGVGAIVGGAIVAFG